MVTWVKSPWGIPADYRNMQGSSVNTYKLVNDQGEAMLVKFSFEPKQGVKNLTSQQAAEIQARDVGHATRTCTRPSSAANFPSGRCACRSCRTTSILSSTSTRWTIPSAGPKTSSRCCRSGALVLNRNPDNFFAEAEQVGLRHRRAGRRDRLLGRQDAAGPDAVLFGHAALPRRPQLPAAARQRPAGAGPRADQPARRSDDLSRGRRPAKNQHVNYEPSSMGGLTEAPEARQGLPSVGRGPSRPLPDHPDGGRLQAGRRALPHLRGLGARRPDPNLVADMKAVPRAHRARMVWHFWHCDPDYGRRVAEGAGIDLEKAKACRRLKASPRRASTAGAAPTRTENPKNQLPAAETSPPSRSPTSP